MAFSLGFRMPFPGLSEDPNLCLFATSGLKAVRADTCFGPSTPLYRAGLPKRISLMLWHLGFFGGFWGFSDTERSFTLRGC